MNQAVLIGAMKEAGIIPVFNHKDVDSALGVMKACYEAGLNVFEFTNRGDHSLAVFKELKKASVDWEDFHLGVGTVFFKDQAADFIEVGADFLVSPVWDLELAEYAKSQNITWIPGIGTVSEAFQAFKFGIPLIKVFPANALGPEFVTSLKSVIPGLMVMPTGGVHPEESNLKTWFDSGVHCVGMGSQLFSKNLIQEKQFEKLGENINRATSILKRFRKSSVK
ncbi:bifunctional 4-hydroxy-2-oxoglutarate aldolase/2-dehydro-3-deoxy-phosphogluconate aldolase [Algoriphagus aestuarii]|nr:bifunctional 4-hydroxy-2-oxoglutarate aldolase/2-dehydro-3-deoxy-phosphogluconate aldolase [Algoriphagus aestuarii]